MNYRLKTIKFRFKTLMINYVIVLNKYIEEIMNQYKNSKSIKYN